jgi:glycerophosphoryl diester phosphodiesterase
MRTVESDFFAPPVPRVIAHRGGAGRCPENTLAAFRASTALGVPYAELDIHATRDGVIVVAHDADLRRTCGRDGRISAIDYAELANADAGFTFTAGGGFPFRRQGLKIPTLEEVFAACPGQCFIVEIKQTAPSVVAAMLEVIERRGMGRRVLIASEHQTPLDEVRALRPGLPTSFSGPEIATLFAALNSGAIGDYRAPADALQIPPRYEALELATPQSVAAAHRLGIELHVWTVNEECEMRALLAMGVDGILTDFPARLLQVAATDSQRS